MPARWAGDASPDTPAGCKLPGHITQDGATVLYVHLGEVHAWVHLQSKTIGSNRCNSAMHGLVSRTPNVSSLTSTERTVSKEKPVVYERAGPQACSNHMTPLPEIRNHRQTLLWSSVSLGFCAYPIEVVCCRHLYCQPL